MSEVQTHEDLGKKIVELEKTVARQKQSQEQLEAVSRIGMLVNSTLNLKDVLEAILQGTVETLNASAGMIFVENPVTERMEWGASLGVSEELINSFQENPMQPEEGLTGQIVRTGESIYIPKDCSSDKRVIRTMARKENFNSFIGVPLYAADTIVGAMNIFTHSPDILTEHDTYLCMAIGSHVGLAIRNAQLFKKNREAKESLKESEEYLSALLQCIRVGVIVHAPDTKVIKCNKTSQELLGLTEEQILGREADDPIWQFFSEDGKIPSVNYPVNQVLKTKNKVENFSATIKRSDTSDLICVQGDAIPDFGADGEISQIVVTFMNISERKKVETEIKRAKKEWVATFDVMSDLVTLQDKDMRFVRANKATHELAQVKPGELNGRHCYEVLLGSSKPCQGCPLLETRQDLRNHTAIIKHEKLNKIFQITASVILDEKEDIQYLVHTARDVTEQKRQEELVLQAEIQQEQLAKVESLKTMAGAIAHRFNNDIMVVTGNLELVSQALPDNSNESKMISNALQAAENASHIGAMMLSYLGQGGFKPQRLLIDGFMVGIVNSFRGDLKPSIILQFIPPDQPLYCSVDHEQMQEVVESILTNAAEVIGDEAGTIEVSFGAAKYTVDSFPTPFQNENTHEGMYSFCQIKDTGCGINPKNISRIFEPFYTTKFVGRGLGLALTVGIMKSHRGAILVDSSPGKGTIVRVLLPYT